MELILRKFKLKRDNERKSRILFHFRLKNCIALHAHNNSVGEYFYLLILMRIVADWLTAEALSGGEKAPAVISSEKKLNWFKPLSFNGSTIQNHIMLSQIKFLETHPTLWMSW